MSDARRAFAESGLDPAEIARRVEEVLAEPLYWFPVRHHSPTVARLLKAALLSRRPKLVLIEGPSEANDLITHIIDSRTEPRVGGVRMIGLGALGYDARPAFNRPTAGKLRKVGMDILVCTPEKLAESMAQIIRG